MNCCIAPFLEGAIHVMVDKEFYMSSFNSLILSPKEDEQFFKRTSLTSSWILPHGMVVHL